MTTTKMVSSQLMRIGGRAVAAPEAHAAGGGEAAMKRRDKRVVRGVQRNKVRERRGSRG